ncbi:MAG: hypothetical protein AAB415_02185 [Patescibacteria group bacterium]
MNRALMILMAIILVLPSFVLGEVVVVAGESAVEIGAGEVVTLSPSELTPAEPVAKIMGVKVVTSVNPAPSRATASDPTVSDRAIDYLIAEQNKDGSWGGKAATKFITTIAVLEALQAHGVTGEVVDQGLGWLEYYIPENNDYLAEQLKVWARAGVGTSTVEMLVNGLDEDRGGFKFNREYEPDPLTTAKAIQALHAANFRDWGDEPNATASLGLRYLINTKQVDQRWAAFEGGVTSLPVTSEVIEALLLWKHRTLGATAIDDTLNPAVTALIGAQSRGGSWGNNLLNTALAYHAIKASGASPIYDAEAMAYFEREQETDGSLRHDLYTTAKVIKALAVNAAPTGLLISDIIPTSNFQTGAVTIFNIRLTNPGTAAIDTGDLHIITDDYHFASFDFEENHLVINAGATLDLEVGISSTRNFQGEVSFRLFVEGEDGVIQPGSYYEEAFTYTADPSNRPGLPLYYVAYKNVANTGTPAITWRWPVKFDPNLNKVALMWRLEGSSTWSGANVTATTTTSNATVGGLTNNATYEVTLGTSDASGGIYFFNGSGLSRVKVSDVANVYTNGSVAGRVKVIDGIIPAGVVVSGVNASTNTTTNAAGEFLQQHIPWGTGYARVIDRRYETFITKYLTADTNLTEVDVFTKLK